MYLDSSGPSIEPYPLNFHMCLSMHVSLHGTDFAHGPSLLQAMISRDSSGRSIKHIPRALVYMCRCMTGLTKISHVSEHTFSITASGDDVPRQLGARSPAGGRERRHLEGGSDAHIRHGLLRVPSPGAIPPEAAPQPLPPRALPHDPAEHQARHNPVVSFSLFSSLLFSF